MKAAGIMHAFAIVASIGTLASSAPAGGFRLQQSRSLLRRLEKSRTTQAKCGVKRRKTSLGKRLAQDSWRESSIEENWNGAEWVNNYRDSIIYHTDGDIAEEFSWTWTDAGWVYRSRYQNMSSGELHKNEYREWEWDAAAEEWTLSGGSRGMIDSVNQDGDRIVYIDAYYADDGWYADEKIVFDNQNRIIAEHSYGDLTEYAWNDTGFVMASELYITENGSIDSSSMSITAWKEQSRSGDTVEYLVDEWDDEAAAWDESVYKVFRVWGNGQPVYDSGAIDFNGEWMPFMVESEYVSDDSAHYLAREIEMDYDAINEVWSGEHYIEEVNVHNADSVTMHAFYLQWNAETTLWDTVMVVAMSVWHEHGRECGAYEALSYDSDNDVWIGTAYADSFVEHFGSIAIKSYWDDEAREWKPAVQYSFTDSADNILIGAEELLDYEADEFFTSHRTILTLNDDAQVIDEIVQWHYDGIHHPDSSYGPPNFLETDEPVAAGDQSSGASTSEEPAIETGWYMIERTSYTYNEEGRVATIIDWIWNEESGEWEKSSRTTKSYAGTPPVAASQPFTKTSQTTALAFNATTGSVRIGVSRPTGAMIELIAANGQVVERARIQLNAGEQSHTISRRLAPGCYLLSLRTPELAVMQRVLITH